MSCQATLEPASEVSKLQAPPQSSQTHLPSRRLHFDSMRALMFISVYAGHVTTSHISSFFGSGFINAASSFGFYAYLVLSGFLITRILIGSDTGKTWSDVREFWLRRTLRIFPIYYLTLAVLFVCGQLPEPLPFVTYVSNIYLFSINQMEGSVCHLWSLAVEEQFYLLFPLAFLFTPKKHRLNLIVALLAICFVVHTTCAAAFPGHKWKLLLPSSGQCLLAGAIAGYYDMKIKQGDTTRLLLVSLALNVALIAWQSFDKTLPHTMIFLDSAALALFFYSLWRTRNQFICKSLSNKLLVHLGQISYAMYLFHLPILYLLIDFPLPEKIAIGFVSTALLASASWYLFESPINNLRNKLIPSRV
jgi:peptidoglycan/LPS O-acetylase OafA/YrhL